MSQPPANIPEQPWTYPRQYPPVGTTPTPAIGGYYTRGEELVVPRNTTGAAPIWQPQQGGTKPKHLIALILAGLGILVIVFITMLEAGFSGTLVGAIAALVPLSFVLLAVRWLDRWEPEPPVYLLLSFAWGGGVATVSAMYLNTKAFTWLSQRIDDVAAVEIIGVAVVAPVVEEILKGVALLGIMLWRRQLINSGLDLIVYAATIASGFAFTENIMYFARGTSMGVFGATFFMRAIMSPFAHIMFTSATAMLLATVIYSRRRRLWIAYPVGTLTAILAHAFWNFTAVVAGVNFLAVFAFAHVPMFVSYVGAVFYARARERKYIVEHLQRYAQAGWFAPHEVEMLGSLAQRSRARRWAGNYGVRAGETMADFQIAATKLALNRRHLLEAAKKTPAMVEELVGSEKEYLGDIQLMRESFLQLAGPRHEGGYSG